MHDYCETRCSWGAIKIFINIIIIIIIIIMQNIDCYKGIPP